MPTRLELNRIPSEVALKPHSLEIVGPVNDITSASKSSIMKMTNQTAIAATWKRDIELLSIRRLTSLFTVVTDTL